MDDYRILRDANIARQAEWDKANASSISFAATELAGEMGELLTECYLVETSFKAVAEELADVAICLDLLALRFDVELPELMTRTGTSGSTTAAMSDGIVLAASVGAVCNHVKKIEREQLGMVGSRSTQPLLANCLRFAALDCVRIARSFGIDLPDAIANKFNQTSAKYGLTAMMELPQ